MNRQWMIMAIRAAGFVHLGIIAANVPLPGNLRVRERLAGVPRFVRQIFYYDRGMRRENRALDLLYVGSLAVLVVIFGMAAVRPLT